jgi:Tfp pilus assembly PilM family ATPase
MGRTNKFCAIQFCKTGIIAVEMAHRGGEFEIDSITEREGSENYSEALFSKLNGDGQVAKNLENDLRSIRKAGEIDAPNISFCLDSRWVFIHSFPLDKDFSEAERADHISWELSNYLTDSKLDDYVTATATLLEMPALRASTILSASVKRELISLLRSVASRLKLEVIVIDVDHFGAEHTLRWNYPEIEQETVSLVGIKPDGIDMSIFQSGRPVSYRWRELRDGMPFPSLLRQASGRMSESRALPKKCYIYGENENASTLFQSGQGDRPLVEVLDPVRNVSLPRQLRRLNRTTFHRYAPAIGLAMREV